MLKNIENNRFKVTVDLHGGALSGVYDKIRCEQLLWQGASDSWSSRDVVIFPFVARLKDKTYTHKGRPYSMENHGLARYNDFKTEQESADSLTLRFDSNEETLKRYPFEFSFFVTYRLIGNSLKVKFRAENKSKDTMHFAVGAHPAYNIDFTRGETEDDISGNRIVFKSEQEAVRYILDERGEFITGETKPFKLKEVPLSKQLFQEHNTLIYGGISGEINLYRRCGDSITFDIGAPPYFALWSHKTRGGYICIEPWYGLPDFADCGSELENKRGINALESGKAFEYEYTTTYNSMEDSI